ncbi:unnamed protein product [Blepharisma stoltei]|uniref:non-specific serine/threonine protein kinase n=1 Tax=Blepharisma stoltei TaxID=1481888 RepID=A0AAU9JW86_9CILI|nr:unnamed protein product [Blepharisma stoltei]
MGCFVSKNNCQSSNKALEEFHSNPSPHKSAIDPSIITMDIRKFYVFEERIGKGHFGEVYLVHRINDINKKFAVKSISKPQFSTHNVKYVKSEIENLQALDHPNIIKLYESYEDDEHIHLVTEYCSGGKLLTKMKKKPIFTEVEAAAIIMKILRAVKYLHERGICHRDIKPDNFLLETEAEDSDIKMIDFGLSHKLEGKVKRMKSTVGTLNYVAPEVLKGNYGFKCDLWSVGIIMFILLTGDMPIKGRYQAEILESLRNYQLNTDSEEWAQLSPWAQNLLTNLLEKDPNRRYDAQTVLKHQWLQDNYKVPRKAIDPKIFEALKSSKITCKFQKEVLDFIVKNIDCEELRDLKNAFLDLDTENIGALTFSELESALQTMNHSNKSEEVKRIITNLKAEDSMKLNYSEFLAATFSSKLKFGKELLKVGFKHFDRDNKGFINEEDIYEALKRSGRKIKKKKVHEIFAEIDADETGKINFKQFRNILLGKSRNRI